MVKPFFLEANKNYRELFSFYVQRYQAYPELPMNIDGILRCIKNIAKETPNQIDHEVRDLAIKTLGYLPKYKSFSRKIAFIDHSYHAKTLSSMFFVEWIKNYVEVDIFWSQAWKGSKDSFIQEVIDNYETIVFWQVFPHENIKISNSKKIFIVPMWDAVYSQSVQYWLGYKKYRFICFCKQLSQLLSSYKIENFYLQVPPPSISSCKVSEKSEIKPSVFFCPRTSQFQWQDLKKIICPEQVSRVVVSLNPDPNNPMPVVDEDDVRDYNICFVRWEKSKQEYLQVLQKCDIYVSPRLYEGIGFSLLDAMACGCVPIANNQATMNEYINAEVGYLIDYKRPKAIDITNFYDKRVKLQSHLGIIENEWAFSSEKLLGWMFHEK